MTSSTSSSRAASARILLLLLLALIGVEVGTRVRLHGLSHSIRQYRSYSDRAAVLARQSGFRVAVVGNSVARQNVDAGLLAERLGAARGEPAHADVFSADHSFINAWYFMVTHDLWRPGNRVDLIVIPFWRTNLYDGNAIDIGRLAQFFTTVEDWPEVLRTDLGGTAQRLDFLLSSVWASFAARHRMQEFVFTRFLPGYQRFAQLEQDMAVAHRTAAGEDPWGTPSLVAFERFLRAAQAHDARLCFVAVPTTREEWNDPYTRVRADLAAAGMGYVDLRGTPGITADDFRDTVHMNARGRERFTRLLADAIVAVPGCAAPAEEKVS